MKLTVVKDRCRGHGLCYSLAPDLLQDDDDEGYVSVRGEVVDVPERQVAPARNAAASCPEQAIEIFDN